MAEAVTPDTVISWFTKYQKNHILKDGIVPKWFHGFISRKQAEEMLMSKPIGCFLIRVSESRIGYTLSYSAKDSCRHFMIDTLPGNRYEIIGDKLRHCSLHDLVAFHSRTPIPPYTELLTEACDQAGENISEDLSPKPALSRVYQPPFPNHNLSNSSAISISSSRLYPNLEQELSAFDFNSVESPLSPSPKSRQKLQKHAKTTAGEEQAKSLPTDCKQKNQEKVVQKYQPESMHTHIRLLQCKKIFKKKKTHSEERMHTKDNDIKVTTQPATLQVASNPDKEEVGQLFGTLPSEYLNPPPFAPGY